MADPLDQLRLPRMRIEPRPEFAAALLDRIRGRTTSMVTATVRYFVADMDAAVDFYSELLGFEVELRPSPEFAMLYRGELRLLLSIPAAHVLPDGSMPEPGGWNRISLQVGDLDSIVGYLRSRGVRFRNDITVGVGARQVLVMDPAGNLIELYEAVPGYHQRLATPKPSS